MKESELRAAFSRALGIPTEQVGDDLAYQKIRQWDSISHMALVAELETAAGIMLPTEDVIDLSSLAKSREILAKHGVKITADA